MLLWLIIVINLLKENHFGASMLKRIYSLMCFLWERTTHHLEILVRISQRCWEMGVHVED